MRFDSSLKLAILAILATGPAFADGDAALGEQAFGKCQACHAIFSDDGTVIQSGGEKGPNLFGVIGRTAGTYRYFEFGEDIISAGSAGLVWDETNLVTYLQDPKAFLRAFLANDTAKSRMTFKLAEGGEDVAAYLASLGAATAE